MWQKVEAVKVGEVREDRGTRLSCAARDGALLALFGVAEAVVSVAEHSGTTTGASGAIRNAPNSVGVSWHHDGDAAATREATWR